MVAHVANRVGSMVSGAWCTGQVLILIGTCFSFQALVAHKMAAGLSCASLAALMYHLMLFVFLLRSEHSRSVRIIFSSRSRAMESHVDLAR